MSESDLQFGMLWQIADCSNTELLRAIASHNERIRIVEAKRLRHPDAKFAERVTNCCR